MSLLLQVKQPAWICLPSAWTVFAFICVTYFLVTGGIIYDVIVEPPSVVCRICFNLCLDLFLFSMGICFD